jgi:hypothetical protein
MNSIILLLDIDLFLSYMLDYFKVYDPEYTMTYVGVSFLYYLCLVFYFNYKWQEIK